MCLELTGPVYIAAGTVLGALIAAFVGIRTSKQQLAVTLKKHEVELLLNQIATLQTALNNVSEPIANVGTQTLPPEQVFSRLIDLFQTRARMFLMFSYLFPKPIEEEVLRVTSQVNQFIFEAKLGKIADENKSEQCLKEIQALDAKIPGIIRERLRILNSRLEDATATK